MKALLKICFLLCFFSQSINADEIDKDRYQGYIFTPQYSDSPGQINGFGDLVNRYLLQKYPAGWLELSKFKGGVYWGGKVALGYIVSPVSGKSQEMWKHKDQCRAYYKEHGKKKEDCPYVDQAISVFENGELDLVVTGATPNAWHHGEF